VLLGNAELLERHLICAAASRLRDLDIDDMIFSSPSLTEVELWESG